MSTKEIVKTDIAVIGAGPGGTAAALTAVNAGLKTVIIDSAEPGGTCLNRGCVPSKTWLAAEHLYSRAGWAQNLGGKRGEPYDFEKIKTHQENTVGLVRKGLTGTFKRKGVEWIGGNATFISDRQVEIDGGEKIVEFKNAIIAVGTEPIDRFGQAERFYNTDTIFSLDRLPASIAIIGAGAAGMEMATFFSGMGCGVTVIEALEDILPTEDGEIRRIVKREFKKRKVTIKTGAPVENAEYKNGECLVEIEGGEVVKATVLLSVTGRKARTESLGLNNAGVSTDVRGFIEVDGTMGTTREGIYAVGDVAGKYLLAYTAHHEGIVAVRNIIGESAHMEYRFVPSIIFSSPEVGSVGKTEEELKQTGRSYRAGRHHIRALARAQASGEIAGMVKVLVGEENTILGIHIASALASELIHSGSTAMAAGMKADKLADTIYGHPTFSEAIPLATADALGKSIYS